jgi:Domain of unknown function (DUF5925)/ATPase family associated with various cellular activities (AAA)
VSGSHEKVELMYDVRQGTPHALFIARVVDRGLPHVSTAGWATSARSLEPAGESLHRVAGDGGEHMLAERDGTLFHVGLMSGWVHVQVAGENPDRVARTMAELKELFPPPDPSSSHKVNVQFWTYGPHGPIPSFREVAVPEWADLEPNYTAPTRAELDRLMRNFTPAHGGQLILWHGEAGTGKTFALRALAWEWRDWCELQYIVDPDSFFGEHADYLMSVLTQPGYAEMPDPRVMHRMMMSGGYVDFAPEEDGDESKAWRLLILEDTGELLTPDAKSIIGQGLSRFLNVVDGLIGQGLRILVLVTTNEPIKALHPAVARPGRCAANIEFEPLSVDEANAWLERHDVEDRVARPTLLGDLYAIEAGQPPGTMPPAGFAG